MSLDCTINNILNYNFTVLDSFAADEGQHTISQHIIIQPLPFFVTAYLKNYAALDSSFQMFMEEKKC